jgi:hypothetical protein
MPNVPGLYLMLEEFPCGSAWRETDETAADVSTVVDDLLTGQYEQPPRIVAFNPIERWSRGFRGNRRGTGSAESARDAEFPTRCTSSSRATSAARSGFRWR